MSDTHFKITTPEQVVIMRPTASFEIFFFHPLLVVGLCAIMPKSMCVFSQEAFATVPREPVNTFLPLFNICPSS